ncbi:hypothetical protein NDU88_007123 [Pleurodeles waltl]|uniref:Uncharacterized protein n=1 Tax=Pleurodeles waltl TaxID=8319 RepID=A0AAV7QNT0_PLEWA|nr:hypothetical protein NDU88_007123 [Pleurodeles waltl]
MVGTSQAINLVRKPMPATDSSSSPRGAGPERRAGPVCTLRVRNVDVQRLPSARELFTAQLVLLKGDWGIFVFVVNFRG